MQQISYKPIGLILDGHVRVGGFDDVTAPNGSLRQLKNVFIKSEYIDVVNAQTNRDLSFLFVVQMDETNSYMLIDKVGYGMMYMSSWWHKEPVIDIDEATFKEAPKGGRDAN